MESIGTSCLHHDMKNNDEVASVLVGFMLTAPSFETSSAQESAVRTPKRGSQSMGREPRDQILLKVGAAIEESRLKADSYGNGSYDRRPFLDDSGTSEMDNCIGGDEKSLRTNPFFAPFQNLLAGKVYGVNPRQLERITKRRKTRTLLEDHYEKQKQQKQPGQKYKHKSRHDHSNTRPRKSGRFVSKDPEP